jgi:HSP20 family molecular chaperone IbpA
MTTSLSKIINNNGQNLFSDFDFILTNFMDSQGRYKFAESSGFPKLNLYSSETEDGKVKYTIEASITGYDKNDIDVIVDRNKLTISYNKDLDKDEEIEETKE